jgi:hypothetical protein
MRRWLGAIAIGAVTAVYAASAPDWILGGDSGEFVTLYARGGVAHPPGYPLYVLLLRAFAWLPVSAPRGASLVTIAIALLAMIALYRACRLWGASERAATIATGVFASSPLAWMLACTPEVFTLNVLLACALMICAAPAANTRGWKRAFATGLVFGMGLSNHHSIVLLLPIAIFGVVEGVREQRWLGGCLSATLGGVLIGLSPYLYLFHEARCVDPSVGLVWGNIHDLRSLWLHFRRAEFGTAHLALRDSPLQPLAQLRALSFNVTCDLIGLPIFAMIVAAKSWRRLFASHARGVMMIALSFLLCGPGFVCLMNISPTGSSARIVERFYLLPEALACLLGALAIDRLISRMRQVNVATAAAFVSVVVLGQFARSAARFREATRPTVDFYIRNTLRIAPENAILIGSGDEKFAGFAYAKLVLALRSDVTFIAPEMLYATWYRTRVSRALRVPLDTPTLNRLALVDELLATGRPVAFAGALPKAVFDRYVTYPFGTLMIVDPTRRRTPDLIELEEQNVHLLALFRLEPTASSDANSWSGVTSLEYARPWVSLEQAFLRAGSLTRAKACHERAATFSPWLR